MSAGKGTPRVPPVAPSVPTPPGTTPTPSNFVIPRTVQLATPALPLGGVFTAQPNTVIPLGTKRITYWITYTRGAAGGFPAFRAEWFNGTEQANNTILDSGSLVPVQPFAEANFYQEELLGPAPATAAAIVYELTFEVPPGTIGARLLAAEQGATGSPGTITIAMTGSG